MTIYIVENYNSCEFEAFEELEQAATYVRQYYKDHMEDLLGNVGDSVERTLHIIKNDLENLEGEYPFIEDTMYIHNVKFHN